MKKVLAMFTAVVLAYGAFGDIYGFKMNCKVPVIKQASYKDFKSTTYNGYLNLSFNPDGTVTTSQAILWGEFAEGKTIRVVDFNVKVMNVYGKNKDKVEIALEGDLGDFEVNLVGVGPVKKSVYVCNDCGEDPVCITAQRLQNASGVLTGTVGNICCESCGCDYLCWMFNLCAENMESQCSEDVVQGTWAIAYNAVLTGSCEEFPACVYNRIPADYLTTD